MAYCTDCGTKIEATTKFCPNCGANLKKSTEKKRKPPKIDMEKGVIKSLKEETSNTIKSKVKKTLTPKIPKEKLTFADTVEQDAPKTHVEKSNEPIQKWMLFYFIINFILVLLYSGQEEVMGISFFSSIIIIAYWIRRKKEKPLNLVLKIVLILQTLLVVSTLMQNLEYMADNSDSAIAVLLLAIFTFVNIKLLIVKNKTI